MTGPAVAIEDPMAAEEMQRKLTTILAADVEGYTRLIREDEERTLKTLAENRAVLDGLIDRHEGRIFSTSGDSVLAEFSSAVEAVRCAIACQEEISSRSAELAPDRRVLFRMGINVGDVVVSDSDLFGDGVNVAARLEGLAPAGGICISGSVHEQVKHKLSHSFEDIGQQTVKNIPEPISAYRLVPGSVAAKAALRSESISAKNLPDKPSIAVLPFDNMSGDPDQEYFSDGISEDLITDLSKVPGLFVVSRHSSFAYKGPVVDIEELAKDLRVRYVLEGSVRRAGDRIRISSKLIDALSGGHVWADRYDRDLEDVFELQDEVVQNIVGVLTERIAPGDRHVVEDSKPTNLEAYDLVLRGRELYHRYAAMENAKAKEALERAIDLDPEYGPAYTWLALCHWLDWQANWSGGGNELIDLSHDAASKAVEYSGDDPLAHLALAITHLFRKERAEADTEYQTALDLQPDQPDVLAHFSELLAYDGRPLEAIEWVRKAMWLNPHYPAVYPWFLGFSQYAARHYEEAVETFRGMPELGEPRRILAASLAQLGRVEEASAEGQKYLEHNPNFSAGYWANTQPFQQEADRNHFVEGYLKAGLPR